MTGFVSVSVGQTNGISVISVVTLLLLLTCYISPISD